MKKVYLDVRSAMYKNIVSRIRSVIVGSCLAINLMTPSVTHAHVSLVNSTPTANAVIATPKQIDLVFNERLLPRASRLELSTIKNGEAAEKVEHIDVEFIHDGRTLRAKLHHSLEAGIYRVQWRAVGDDNHPMTGEFSFTVE